MSVKKYQSERMKEFVRPPGKLHTALMPFYIGLLLIGLSVIDAQWSNVRYVAVIFMVTAIFIAFIEWISVLRADKRDQQETVSKI